MENQKLQMIKSPARNWVSGFVLSFLLLVASAASAQMSGTYTIDPSGSGTTNYKTFSAAVSALSSQGVNGPVLFKVAAATYTEQVNIPSISGASSTNRIVFDGIDSSTRIVTYGTSSSTNAHTWRFNGATYVTVRNMKIKSTGSYGIGVHVYGNCNNIIIEKCKIEMPISTANNYRAVHINNSTAANNGGYTGGTTGSVYDIYVDSNNIAGGYYGVFFTSSYSNTSRSEIIYVRGNKIFKAYNIGVVTTSCRGYLVEGNYIKMKAGVTNSVGVSTCNGSVSTSQAYQIIGNTIENAGQYGIRWCSPNISTTGDPSKVINNYIKPTFSNANSTGITLSHTRNVEVLHNTVLMNIAGGNGVDFPIDNYSGMDFMNNIVMLNHPSASGKCLTTAGGTLDNCDYNIFVKNGNDLNLVTINGSTFTKDNFKGGSGFNQNSTIEDPLLASIAKPVPDNICLKGTNLGVKVDIYGDIRNNPPQIGCAEPGSGVPDDAAMMAIIEPSGYPLSTGNQDVKVIIRNSGNKKLTSVDVKVSLGTTTRTINWTGTLNSCETDTVVFTGSNQVNLISGTNTLNAWVSNANSGGVDDNPTNDSISVTYCTPVAAGTYSINASGTGDFINFTDFIDKVNCGGISGPITITVADGNYTDQILLSRIKGASSTNKITIRGSNAANVVMTRPTSASAYGANVLIEATPYVTIENITFINNNTGNTANIQLTGGSDYTVIKGCSLIYSTQSVTSTTNNLLIAGAWSATGGANEASNCIIENNYMSNAYTGIRIVGSDGNAPSDNIFLNNTLIDNYYYGFYSRYLENTTLTGNKFLMRGNTTGYGLYLYYNNQTNLYQNAVNSSGHNGVYWYYENYRNQTGKSEFHNNMIGGGFGNYTFGNYGMYAYRIYNVNVYHNAFYLDDASTGGTSTTTYPSTLYMNYSYNNDFKNNIFVYEGTDPRGGVIRYLPQNGSNTFDYNQYYNKTGFLYDDGSSQYFNLLSWQLVDQNSNANSQYSMPVFVGTKDLHLKAGNLGFPGIKVGVTEDFDGDSRCLFMPTMGADESIALIPLPEAGFLPLHDTAFVNSPTLFMNQASEGEFSTYQWFVNDTLRSTDRNFRHKFTLTGNYEVKLVQRNCAGYDTATKIILVANPKLKPVIDFLADKTLTEELQVVKFTDLSEKGPTVWEWKISPKEVYDPNSGFNNPSFDYVSGTSFASQNPEMIFFYPGLYEVCLIASNAAGEDSLCKTQYINVRGTNNLCNTTISREAEGVLYDDGGPDLDYSAGINCSYLIEPCASEVIVNLEYMNLKTGDFIRIYDGQDNSGTPLWNVSASQKGFTGFLAPANSLTLKASSGVAYVEFSSAPGTSSEGFRITWSSTPAVVDPPVVSLDVPTATCDKAPVFFKNNTQGKFVHYSWYIDTVFVGNQKDLDYTFAGTGNYSVKLIAENCGGKDSAINVVNISTPSQAPGAAFVSDLKTVNINEIVKFEDVSTGCVNARKWKITGSKFSYEVGSDSFSRDPIVKFSAPGCYDVQLMVTNDAGTDTLTMPCYINVVGYCTPWTVNISNDLGISRVVFNTIDNSSEIGDNSYTDYSASISTSVYRGGMYTLKLERTTTANFMNRAVWIDFDQDGKFSNNEQVGFESSAKTTSWTTQVSIPTNAVPGSTRMRVGTNLGKQDNLACGGNFSGEYEDYRIFILRDDVAPEITLAVNDTLETEIGYAFTDPGYTAWDNVDGNLTDSVKVAGSVDINTTGTYSITYSVSDKAGNLTTVTRTVIVIPDQTAPVITLTDNAVMFVHVFSTWNEPGFTATDNLDGIITSNVIVSGLVNTNILGTYNIDYSVADNEGNSTVVSRTVHVIDTLSPVITLIGQDPFHVEVYTTFNDPGISISDNYDTLSVYTTSGTVDVNMFGTYEVIYCAKDKSGNETCISRNVVVGDTTAPTVTITGSDTLYVEANSTFFDPGVQAADNYWNKLTTVQGGTWPGHTDTLGTFTIEYQVTDGSGNTGTATRILIIRDTRAPRISLNGNEHDTVLRWRTYIDPSVTVTDNYDRNPSLITGGNFVDAQLEGVYFMTYQAVDQSGNKSAVITRFIHVVANTSLKERDERKMVNVYPNPTRGQFSVEVNFPEMKQARISILNLLGEEISILGDRGLQSEVFSVDLSGFSNGIYFLSIKTGDQAIMKRIILAK